jgi:hypothetical protein
VFSISFWGGRSLFPALLLAIALSAQAWAIDPPVKRAAESAASVGPFPPASVGAYDGARQALGFAPESAARDTVWLPSPRGALLRSLALPGWGQIYNHQPLKAPVIWAGLGTLVGVSAHSNNRAILFRRAAIYHDCQEQPEAVPAGFCDDSGRFAGEFERADALTAGPLTGTSARNLRDQFRRQRDLFALISFLAYGLQALDAYVAAELADFDVGEDLTVGLTPHRPGLALRWRF